MNNDNILKRNNTTVQRQIFSLEDNVLHYLTDSAQRLTSAQNNVHID